jgi:hypothetical protein
MRYSLIFLLMAVIGLAAVSQAAAGFRISGLQCVRSMPDPKPDAAAPGVIPHQAAHPAGGEPGRESVLSGTAGSATSGLQAGDREKQAQTHPGAGAGGAGAWLTGR